MQTRAHDNVTESSMNNLDVCLALWPMIHEFDVTQHSLLSNIYVLQDSLQFKHTG